MEFSSVIFIWAFLPLAIILYYSAFAFSSGKGKHLQILNGILLFFSAVFYLWAGFRDFFLLLTMVLLNYGAGRWIDHFSSENDAARKKRKAVFITALVFNLIVLAFFKYFNMMISLAQILLKPRNSLIEYFYALAVFNGSRPDQMIRIVMPLAISFTTFQAISYLADVYKGKISAEKSLFHFSLYNCLFVQLVQGPIMRYQDLGSQIKVREHSLYKFAEGIRRFCFGLGKKVLISNTLAVSCDKIWAKPVTELYTSEAWLGLILYLFQIYYDFSGYTDMAIGVGQMFGFRICENFNYPLTSESIQDFWRRWHISLSTWFRDYLYIPLGGSRKGEFRTFLNITIVFLATGLWHGANLTFLLWGFIVAIQNIIERAFLGSWIKKNPVRIINWLYFYLTLLLEVVLFRAPNLYHAVKYYGVLLRPIPESAGTSILSYFSAEFFIAFLAAIFCMGFVQRTCASFWSRVRENTPAVIIRTVLAFAIFAWALMSLLNGSYNPSIYTNF